MSAAESDHDFGVPIPGSVLPPHCWAKTGLKQLPAPGPLSFVDIFGRNAPVLLDLGCGNGRFTLSHALQNPDWDHLGVDVLPLVVRYATKRANQRGLHNVRLAVVGAFELLDQYIAPASVAAIHLYHPQPYPDVNEAEHRLVTPDFLALVHRSLQPGGKFVVQTDNRGYWTYIRRVAPLLFDFQELNGRWPDAPAGRTRREIYARRKGMRIYKGEGIVRPLPGHEIEEIVRNQPTPRFDASR